MFTVVFLAEFFRFYQVVSFGEFRHLVGSVRSRTVWMVQFCQMVVSGFHLFVSALWLYV